MPGGQFEEDRRVKGGAAGRGRLQVMPPDTMVL